MSSALLEMHAVCRHFSLGDTEIPVLNDINLTIYAGEMIAIMGASGSGKSTLMNILGCLDRPSRGSYRIAGRETQDLTPDELAFLRREHFGFIFQRYHLLPHLTALDNVALPAVYAGTKQQERQERAANLLSQLGLAAREHHLPNQLSGGEQQRVSIARALMNGGEVILADEPTGALDRKSGQDVMAILHALQKDGHTIIIVTHDPSVASHADRIFEIEDGHIITKEKKAIPPANDLPAKRATQRSPHWARGRLLVETVKSAFAAMAAHRLRTCLSMLGMIIGIASVVSVMALGKGAQESILDQIRQLGTHTIRIYAGNDLGDDEAGVQPLGTSDLAALETQDYIDSVTPTVSSSQLLRYQNQKIVARISGVSEAYFRIHTLLFSEGSAFRHEDVKNHAQVVVLTHALSKKLFPGTENPLGAVIFLGKLPCIVIGVTQRPISVGFDHLMAWTPYTTLMHRVLGRKSFDGITVRGRDTLPSTHIENNITALLTEHHGRKDFSTRNMDNIIKAQENATRIMTLFVTLIALITLIVGGIGVMNIMLVSVTERTREIGIRIAIGARQSDILQQFLIEAVIICLLGGLIGLLLSASIGFLFSMLVSITTMQFSLSAIVFAVLCATGCGILFGYIPARNAARLSPIDALARE